MDTHLQWILFDNDTQIATYTILHKIVNKEKIPMNIRTDPRLFKNHTTDEIFKVFLYARKTFTRMKNHADMPSEAPRPQRRAFRFL